MDSSTSCAEMDEDFVTSASSPTCSTSESEATKLLDLPNDVDIRLSIREHLNMCFKPTYKLRKLKNKGAILVIVCNFLVTGVYYYIGIKSVTPEQL